MTQLEVVKGDKLGFNVTLTSGGQPYTLQDGETIFFIVGASCTSGQCVIHEEQSETQFNINEVDLAPGIYDFEIGIKFIDSTIETVIDSSEGKLKVKPRIADR